MRDSCPVTSVQRRPRGILSSCDRDGQQVTTCVRQECVGSASASSSIVLCQPLVPRQAAVQRDWRNKAATFAKLQAARKDAVSVARWLAEKRLTKSNGPSASERLDALRMQVRARQLQQEQRTDAMSFAC